MPSPSGSAPGRPIPYIPEIGKSVVKKVTAGAGVTLIDLSLNESSFGASPRATAAAKQRSDRLMRYPDPASTELRQAIGKRFGLDPDCIVCGNGSEEIIDIISRLYARPGDEILFPTISFLQFPIVAMRTGATPVPAPVDSDFKADVDALLSRVGDATRIVFVDNPNNPLGTYLAGSALRRLRDALPSQVVLVIDSAYAEYVEAADYDDGIGLVAGHENVIVTRTFSKAYGLAALRVGWGYCAPATAAVINRMRGIGNINAIAQEAAIAALSDPGFVDHVRARANAERRRLVAALEAMGLGSIPSVTNFVMVRFPTAGNNRAGAAKQHLKEAGIIVRGTEDYDLPDYLRITIGTAEENDAVIRSLRAFMI